MKTPRLICAFAVLALLFTVTVSTATAGGMGNGAAQRMKLVIEAIDAAAGTVEFKSMVDNSEHSYKVDATTHVKIINVKGTLDEIKPGMKVANYTVKDGQTLSFIDVTPAK